MDRVLEAKTRQEVEDAVRFLSETLPEETSDESRQRSKLLEMSPRELVCDSLEAWIEAGDDSESGEIALKELMNELVVLQDDEPFTKLVRRIVDSNDGDPEASAMLQRMVEPARKAKSSLRTRYIIADLVRDWKSANPGKRDKIVQEVIEIVEIERETAEMARYAEALIRAAKSMLEWSGESDSASLDRIREDLERLEMRSGSLA